jgi:hypothetical protein
LWFSGIFHGACSAAKWLGGKCRSNRPQCRLCDAGAEHDQEFIEMNESHDPASRRVQRPPHKVTSEIDETGHPTGTL